MKTLLIVFSLLALQTTNAQFLLKFKSADAMDMIHKSETVQSVDVKKIDGKTVFEWKDSDANGILYQLLFNSKDIAVTYRIIPETKDALGNMLVAVNRDYKVVTNQKIWTTVMNENIVKIVLYFNSALKKYNFDFTIAN